MKNEKEDYDINKFPAQPGLIVFGISMSQIGNIQNAKKCFDYALSFFPKIKYPYVGSVFLYSDGLYLYSTEGKPSKLKTRFQTLANSHKFEFKKILKKRPAIIPSSFSFITWSQILLESKEYTSYIGKLKAIYNKDKKFQEYVKQDIKSMKKKVNEDSISFILEEILVLYLISKGKIKLPNEYVNGKEKWVLNAYPGKPLLSEVYLYQKNFFRLKNPQNKYENSYYDLQSKKLYNY